MSGHVRLDRRWPSRPGAWPSAGLPGRRLETRRPPPAWPHPPRHLVALKLLQVNAHGADSSVGEPRSTWRRSGGSWALAVFRSACSGFSGQGAARFHALDRAPPDALAPRSGSAPAQPRRRPPGEPDHTSAQGGQILQSRRGAHAQFAGHHERDLGGLSPPRRAHRAPRCATIICSVRASPFCAPTASAAAPIRCFAASGASASRAGKAACRT